MSQKIHYRDDLFFLSVCVKTLDAGLTLEADPEYFQPKLLADLGFIASSLETIGGLLLHNLHLVERPEYLKLLERIHLDFIGALGRIEAGEGSGVEVWRAQLPQVRTILEAQRRRLQELRAIAAAEGAGEEVDIDLVSGDEIEQLLGPSS